jgi:hypothetical protein
VKIPAYARLASRLLARAMPEGVPPPTAEARSDAIAVIEAAIVAKRRRKLWMRRGSIGMGLVAAATLLVLHVASEPWLRRLGPYSTANHVAVVVRPLGQGARIVGGQILAGNGQALWPGNRVRALPHGHAVLSFASGSQVTLDEDTEVQLVEAADSQVLALEHGAVRAEVKRLAATRRFVVRTEDAEIEVHGTSFRVAIAAPDAACGGGSITRLEVYKGLVSVRAHGVEIRVPAGDRWPHGCEATQANVAAVPGVVSNSETARATPKGVAALKPVQGARSVPARGSELGLENDMFAEATAARRAGDLESALRELERLLARFPDSPLAEGAEAERMKLLQALDRTRAREAARAYMARYPNGFARADAEGMLGAPR